MFRHLHYSKISDWCFDSWWEFYLFQLRQQYTYTLVVLNSFANQLHLNIFSRLLSWGNAVTSLITNQDYINYWLRIGILFYFLLPKHLLGLRCFTNLSQHNITRPCDIVVNLFVHRLNHQIFIFSMTIWIN